MARDPVRAVRASDALMADARRALGLPTDACGSDVLRAALIQAAITDTRADRKVA